MVVLSQARNIKGRLNIMSQPAIAVTFIPLCLFCSIDITPNATETRPLGAVLDIMPSSLNGTPFEGLPLDTLADLVANIPGAAPDQTKLRTALNDNSMLKLGTVLSTSPITVRQVPASDVQGYLAPLSNILRTLLLRRRPESPPAPAPAEVPASHKSENKVDKHDHKHAKVSQYTAKGVVPGGHYYEGWGGNGEYFNDEKQEIDSLEVHSHEDLSPGRVYNDKSEHPYYVVDRPAAGPAPPPITYYTSGLRSDPDAATAAWNDYVVKLKEYNDFYYPKFQIRNSRTTDANSKVGADGSLEAVNQLGTKINSNEDTANTDRIDEPGQAADV